MKKILIVDDAAFMRLNIKKIINASDIDAKFTEADTGITAIEQYKTMTPDLTIMDITMPDMDGITALREIRQYDPSAKVLMCSAMGQQQRVVEAIEAGALSFIVKPFESEKLINTIKKII